jgi:hypothetical protein
MSIDGAGAQNVANGSVIELDTKPHTLTFTCAADACVQAVSVPIGEGDDDTGISATLAFKAATLVVTGDPTATYSLTNRPGLTIIPGAPTTVQMIHQNDIFQVVQLPSQKQQNVKLYAGKSATIQFQD